MNAAEPNPTVSYLPAKEAVYMRRWHAHIIILAVALFFIVPGGCTDSANIENNVQQTKNIQTSADTADTTEDLQNFMYGDWRAERLIAYNFYTNEHEPTPDYRKIVGRAVRIEPESLTSDFDIDDNINIKNPIFTFEKKDPESFLIRDMGIDYNSQKNFNIAASDNIYYVTLMSGDKRPEAGYFIIINRRRLILNYMNSFFELERIAAH